MQTDAPTMERRLERAVKEHEHSRVFAALARPFDHIPTPGDCEAALAQFYTELDRTSEEQYRHILSYLDASDLKLQLEHLRWWLRRDFPRLASNVLVLAVGTLFFLQGVFGLPLVEGEWSFELSGWRGVVSYYHLALLGLLIPLLVFTARTRGTAGTAGMLLRAVLLPLYLGVRFTLYRVRGVYRLAFESFFVEDYRQRGWFASTWLPVMVGGLNLLACCIIVLGDGRALVLIGVVILGATLILGLVWFYHWNFQPLFFFKLAVRSYLYLECLGIETDRRRIGKSRLRKSQIQRFENVLGDLVLFCQRIREISRSNRLDVLAANSFIVMFLLAFGAIVVEYYLLYRGLYQIAPDLFVNSLGATIAQGDLWHLSLNNLPIGGNLRVSTQSVWMEFLWLSQRLVAVSLLVVAIFAYSIFSDLQLGTEKERLEKYMELREKELSQAREAYEKLEPLSEE